MKSDETVFPLTLAVLCAFYSATGRPRAAIEKFDTQQHTMLVGRNLMYGFWSVNATNAHCVDAVLNQVAL